MKEKTIFRKKGFTLIELLVVVLIISILAAVAVPQYKFAVVKSKALSYLPLLKSIRSAQEAYYLANGYYAMDLRQLDIMLPQECTIAYDQYNQKSGASWSCGNEFFLDNPTKGAVHIEYCPGSTDSFAHCKDKRDFLLSMFYWYPDTATNKPYAGMVRCSNLTAFGKKMCKSVEKIVDALVLI